MTVREALQTMHDHRFLTLPVCEENGPVVGLVDVMDVIYGCGGVEGWRSVFESALDIDDDMSDNQSAYVSVAKPKVSMSTATPVSIPFAQKHPVITVSKDSPFVSQTNPCNLTMTIEFE